MQSKITKQTVCAATLLFSVKAQQSADTLLALPDYMPEVMSIVTTDAQVFVTNRQISDKKLVVEGNVRFCVIYTSPQQELRSVTQNAAWHYSCDAELSGDALIRADPIVQRVNSQASTARKIEASTQFCVNIDVYGGRCSELIADAESEGVELLQQRTGYIAFDGAPKKQFAVSDDLELATTRPSVTALLCSTMTVSGTDCRISSGKAVVKADLNLTVMYIGDIDDGQPQVAQFQIPVSQVLDVENPDADGRREIDLSVSSYTLNTVTDADGQTRRLALDTVICIQLLCLSQKEALLATDCHGTQFQTTVEYSELTLLQSCEKTNLTVTADGIAQRAANSVARILDSNAETVSCDVSQDGDVSKVTCIVNARVFALDDNGDLILIEKQLTGTQTVPTSDRDFETVCGCEIKSCTASPVSDGVSISVAVAVTLLSCQKQTVRALTDIEVDGTKPVPHRQEALILRYVADGETLWDIAGEYGISVNDIQELNTADTGDPPPNTLLLIAGM